MVFVYSFAVPVTLLFLNFGSILAWIKESVGIVLK
jgi:hypothetical protein